MPVRPHVVLTFRGDKNVVIGPSSGKVPKGIGRRTYERLQNIITCKRELQIPFGFYAGQTYLSFREMVKAFLRATLSHFGKK